MNNGMKLFLEHFFDLTWKEKVLLKLGFYNASILSKIDEHADTYEQSVESLKREITNRRDEVINVVEENS